MSKESLLVEPDPELVDEWRSFALNRTADAPTWTLITELFTNGLARSEDWLRTLKHVCEASPEMAVPLLTGGLIVVDDMSEWLQQAAPRAQHPELRLQLNVAHTAVSTAFTGWSSHESYRRFLRAARSNLGRVGRGFASD